MLGAARAAAAGPGSAAATVATGPDVVATRSRTYPDTEQAIGWQVGAGGFRIVLSAGVPDLIDRHLGKDVAALLGPHGLDVADIGTWVAHAGGPKILDATARSLDLRDGALDASWRSLARVGNLSSSSVLHVLADTIATRSPAPGSYGVLFAMGPGLTSELVLLRWPGGGEAVSPGTDQG
jgi:alkylresorcinol/alkylpyrone synthase